MKPSDVYVGAIDFFSSVVPGAITAYILLTSGWISRPALWYSPRWGSPVGWVIFLITAYLLGHLLSAMGSVILDPLYDRFYAKSRRANSKYVRSRCPIPLSLAEVSDDELLKTAKTLKRRQLEELASAAELSADDITDTFWWAGAVVRMKSSAGAAEVEALMAQSKLFRAVTLLVLPGAFWLGSSRLVAVGIWAALFLLCLWRFLDLRWKAVERTYEYFIVASLFKPESSESPLEPDA